MVVPRGLGGLAKGFYQEFQKGTQSSKDNRQMVILIQEKGYFSGNWELVVNFWLLLVSIFS